MKVLYEAIDGSIFNDQNDCEVYEASINHSALFDISFYDSEGNEYSISDYKPDIFNDLIYQRCGKVFAHNEDELKDLQWLAEECGWCEFEQITDVGIWVRHEDLGNGTWEHVWK